MIILATRVHKFRRRSPEAPGHQRKLVIELWLYPDGSRILELSTKGLPGEAFQAGIEARAYLDALGPNLSGEQKTKTKTALEFYGAELRDQRETD